jgi:hypothetical protein
MFTDEYKWLIRIFIDKLHEITLNEQLIVNVKNLKKIITETFFVVLCNIGIKSKFLYYLFFNA